MGNKTKEFKGEEFEVLDHDEVPGYRTAFHIIISLAVIYLMYIFLSGIFSHWTH